MRSWITLSGLLIAVLLLAGCRGGKGAPTPPPTPTLFVVKTVIGEGRSIEGSLSIEGDCVRVKGQALAWKPMLDVKIMGDTLRVTRKWNGQEFLLRAKDNVLVMGECIYKGEGSESRCVTPSVEEVNAVTGCETGPYFVTANIRKIETPTPIPPSP